MFRNYLLIAWRNLRKNKVFSCINIFGLALGMAACLLILQYVCFEWSYDAFHPEGKNIYRIRYDYRPQPGLLYSYATTYPGVGPRIRETFPEVEDFLRLHRVEAVVSYGDKQQREPALFFADASFSAFLLSPCWKVSRQRPSRNPTRWCCLKLPPGATSAGSRPWERPSG